MSHILDIEDLTIEFKTPKGQFRAVDHISFSLDEGETLCIVGESGCGKSVTSLAVMGLLPKDSSRITSGKINYKGEDLLTVPKKKRRQLRGSEMAMIFQSPLSSLDPLFTIGSQMAEGMRMHLKLGKKEIRERSLKLLADVGIQQPERVINSYPHQLSGGMIQRVMIAIGLATNPKILIADEPTTALDVTVQAQVLELMDSIRKKYGTSIILITHNMGVVARMSDRVIVMYAGEIVEQAKVTDLFARPSHPYTQGLLECIPTLGEMPERIPSIPGMVPALTDEIPGCIFSERCPHCMNKCKKQRPPRVEIEADHYSSCWLHEGGPA